MDADRTSQRRLVGARGVIRLRWLACWGHLVMMLIAWATGGTVPWLPYLAVLSVGVTSNQALSWSHRHQQVRSWGLGAAIALDVLLITAVLGATSGAASPFSFLYLVPVVLSAMVLSKPASWGVLLLGVLAYASLFGAPDPGMHHGGQMRAHLVGMWVAYAVTGSAIVYSVTRLRDALGEVEAQLAESERQRDRASRLASLATLAAGAAHELATPLSTIAIAAGELPPESRSDAQLIRDEVERCHEILRQLSADAGTPLGEMSQRIALVDLVEEVLDGRAWAKDIELQLPDPEAIVRIPVGLVSQAIRRLLGNARDAGGPIELRMEADDRSLRVAVSDQGKGMPPELLARATDPFFTTKPDGMGLGLFFVTAVAERLGGRFRLESPGKGIVALLELPRETC